MLISLNSGGKAKLSQQSSNAIPWVLAVRWWWLKGIRARSAGQEDVALALFRRCENLLSNRRRRTGDLTNDLREDHSEQRGEGEEKEEDDDDTERAEVAVLLPYCVVHPRIDLHVRKFNPF